jgi:ferredoxin-NADP reductase
VSALLAPSRRTLPIRRLGAPASSTSALEANATIAWRDDLTATVARFGIRPDGGVPALEPGQYVALSMAVDGRVIQRPYSAASASTDTGIELLIRLVSGGALTPALWRARPGDRIRIGPPKGLFRLEPGDGRTHLLLATGTGIAPLVAMATALRARGAPPNRVVVVHGVRDPAELAYRDRLLAWQGADEQVRYAPVVSGAAAGTGWAGRRGRIDAALPSIVGELGIEPSKAVAYLCGSPAMIDGVGRVLRDIGVAPEAVRSERYWTAGPAARS